MKHILLFILLSGPLFQQRSYGQTDQSAKLSELKAPSSPAFTVLGIQPNDISRPKDMNSLELSLLNAVSTNNALAVPTNFALEATPYWLKGRNITFSKLESTTGLLATLWQTLSVSLATSQRKNYLDSTQKVTQFGIGARAYLVKGRLANSSAIGAASGKIQNVSLAILSYAEIIRLGKRYINHNPKLVDDLSVGEYRKLLLDLLQFPFTKIRALPARKNKDQKSDSTRAVALAAEISKSKDVRREFVTISEEVATPYINQSIMLDEQDALQVLDSLLTEIQTSYNKNKLFAAKIDEVRQYREKRVGWLLEMAGAAGLETPRPGIHDVGVGKYGGWLTLTNRPENQPGFEWIVLARFLGENSEIRRQRNYDAGTRLVYDNGKLIVSGEALVRSAQLITRRDFVNGELIKESITSTYWRWGLNLGYRINPKLVIQATVAKSFDNDLINKGGYLSVLGVNFGFGQPVLIPD